MKDLKFKNGEFLYRGYNISQTSGIGHESDYNYVWTEWLADSDFDYLLTENSLDALLDLIDHRIENNLTGK